MGTTEAPDAPAAGGAGAPDGRGTSELLRSAVANSRQLALKELELLKLELVEIMTARLVAAALAVTAGVIGLVLLALIAVTGAKALEVVLAPWLAWLIVTGAYAIVTLALLGSAYRKATHPPSSPDRTRAAHEATMRWARERVAPLTNTEEGQR